MMQLLHWVLQVLHFVLQVLHFVVRMLHFMMQLLHWVLQMLHFMMQLLHWVLQMQLYRDCARSRGPWMWVLLQNSIIVKIITQNCHRLSLPTGGPSPYDKNQALNSSTWDGQSEGGFGCLRL